MNKKLYGWMDKSYYAMLIFFLFQSIFLIDIAVSWVSIIQIEDFENKIKKEK